MSETRTASFKPSSMVQGGLLDDADATIKEARFVTWDYQGKIPAPILALALTLTPDEGEEVVQYFSAGDLKNWVPSEDGKSVIAVGTAAGLNNNSNFATFTAELVNNGFPENKIDDDISVIEGLYAHFQRKAQPKRGGLIKREDGRESTVLVVTKIHRLPWDKAAKKAAPVGPKTATAGPAGPKTAAPAKAKANNEEVDTKGQETVMTVLMEAGGSITKAKLSAAVFKQLASDPARNSVVTRVYQDEFLSAEGRPWKYENGVITLEG